MKPARLGDAVVSMKNGMYKPASEYGEDGVPCLRMYNIEAGAIVWRDIKRMRVSAAELEDYGLREGDLLVNRVNSRELVGKTACIPAALEPSVFESKNIRVRLDSSKALPKFISYQLLAGGRRHFEGNAQQVVGMASISQGQIADFPIVLTDIDEQHDIVAEIEKQFSRLDEAVAGLRRVKANLKRYKAAILKAAVEGRLVPSEADLAHREGRNYETGAQLLQRILETRRSQWQGKGKYKEPATPDTSDLPELPEEWTWASTDQITRNFDGIRIPVRAQDREQRQGLYPYYGASGVIDHVDDFLFDGEYLLIAEDGANLLSRSTSIAFMASGKFWVNNHAHVVRTTGGVAMGFLEVVLNGKDLAPFITGSAQPKLTQAALNKIPVPLPPLAEQHRIAAEVDRLLSIAREAEAEVETNLKRAQALRQAILSKAFTGDVQ